MTTTRARPAIAAAIFAVISASGAGSAAFAEPPARPPAGKPAAADKPGETVPDADAQKLVAFFEKLVGIAVATQHDCAKMASGFRAHVDANQALLKQASEAMNQGKKLPPAARQKLEGKINEFWQAVARKCSNDKTVQVALMRIFPGKMSDSDRERERDRDADGDRDRDRDKDRDKDRDRDKK